MKAKAKAEVKVKVEEGGGEGGGEGMLESANVLRGGQLYDQWWVVTGDEAPVADHSLWATRPDQDSNVRTGADTWRCKECHGWDYKGVDGAYASGSHRTGIAGIFGITDATLRTKAASDVFAEIKTGHSYGDVLSDDDIWDVTKFVLEGQLDTDDIIDATGAFIGDPAVGETSFAVCAGCHGTSGLTPPPGHDHFDEFPGLLADENPWEFQHKVSYAQPGTPMPPQAAVLSVSGIGDLGAYAQTLPTGELLLEMASTGHWHATRSKTLSFTATDSSGNVVTGLSPTVTVKTKGGSVATIQATDNDDGTYSADHTAWDVGSGYSMAYTISISVEYAGANHADAWPVEVVRDGNEGIMPDIDGTLYAYQVRYAWDPGTIYASDVDEVTMYFEPRRAIQEGGEINTEQPYRNTFNHITDLVDVTVLLKVNEVIVDTLVPTYAGLGIYEVTRIFTEAEVGDYTVSFLFTDSYNNFTIDASETDYPLAVFAPEETPAPVLAALNIEMASAGHWHATRSKTLSFTLTDDGGNVVTGLSPTVTVKTKAGTVTTIEATEDSELAGTYSADHTAVDVGSGYSMAYSISLSVEYDHEHYFDAWPVEVVRDGNEGIMPDISGTLYAYQVRYAWDPGTIYASDADEVTMYFEPRRAIQEGGDINTEQPYRNTFNHITDLVDVTVQLKVGETVVETLTPAYAGLGIYKVSHIFTETEVGSGKDYTVSFLFTDPYNGFVIEESETDYPLTVSTGKQAISYDPDTPASVLLAGAGLFGSACGACHDLPTEETILAYSTDDALVYVAWGMATEAAHLTEEEAENVVHYLLGLRHV